MYLQAVSFYNVNQTKRPNFTGLNAQKTIALAQEAVSVISDIFAKPVEKRSHHLIHEINPNTGLPLNGRFKLIAADGAEITVSRSMARVYGENVIYFNISALKNGVKDVIRLNPENNKIIKSQISHGVIYEPGILYYGDKELSKNSMFSRVLGTYLPEIKKVDMQSKQKFVQVQKPKAVKRTLTQEEADNIVLKELSKPAQILGLSDNEPLRMPAPQVLVKKNPKDKFSLDYVNSTKQKNDIKIFSKQVTHNIEDIVDIAEQYSGFFNSIKPYIRKSILTEMFEGIISTSGRIRSAVVLENVLPGNLSAKIFPYKGTNLLKININDSNYNIVRGYLIKNYEKLIRNYNINTPNALPYTPKYMTESEYEQIRPVFEADINAIKAQMDKIGKIIAGYNLKS